MVRQSIRQAGDLIRRSEGFTEGKELCVIPEFGLAKGQEKLVFVEEVAFRQSDVDQFTEVLSVDSAFRNRWLNSETQPGEVVAQPPLTFDVPKIMLSRAMNQDYETSTQTAGTLLYLAVIAGRSGTTIVRTVTAPSKSKLATAIFFEAINGYSTIFTAACLAKEFDMVSEHSFKWVQASTLSELKMMAQQNLVKANEPQIGVLC